MKLKMKVAFNKGGFARLVKVAAQSCSDYYVNAPVIAGASGTWSGEDMASSDVIKEWCENAPLEVGYTTTGGSHYHIARDGDAVFMGARNSFHSGSHFIGFADDGKLYADGYPVGSWHAVAIESSLPRRLGGLSNLWVSAHTLSECAALGCTLDNLERARLRAQMVLMSASQIRRLYAEGAV